MSIDKPIAIKEIFNRLRKLDRVLEKALKSHGSSEDFFLDLQAQSLLEEISKIGMRVGFKSCEDVQTYLDEVGTPDLSKQYKQLMDRALAALDKLIGNTSHRCTNCGKCEKSAKDNEQSPENNEQPGAHFEIINMGTFPVPPGQPMEQAIKHLFKHLEECGKLPAASGTTPPPFNFNTHSKEFWEGDDEDEDDKRPMKIPNNHPDMHTRRLTDKDLEN